MSIPTAPIRKFLQKRFGSSELIDFLLDYFPPVYDSLAEGMSKNEQISELIEYCYRRSLLPKLLKNLQQVRPDEFAHDDLLLAPPVAPQPTPQPPARPAPTQTAPIVESPKPAPETDTNEQEEPDSFVHPITGKEMIKIPAGTFLCGEELEEVYLDSFWIDKTPVTQAEYKRFIDANPDQRIPTTDAFTWVFGGRAYRWDKGERMYPEGKADHPVVLVSLVDAAAYAHWAKLELPDEQQWEKAARGTNGRQFPWGDSWRINCCNSDETKIGGTTPVGQYSPQGDSPYGCVDMLGNVWEWTTSLSEEGSQQWILRGGTWYHVENFLSLTARKELSDFFIDNDIGFRLISRSWVKEES